MKDHVRDLLPLDATGDLDAGEAERVASHLRECAACASEAAAWRDLAKELWRLSPPRPSPALVARTRQAAEGLVAQRAERLWAHATLGFLVAFSWTATVAAWLLIDELTGELGLRLQTPVGAVAVWSVVYVLAGTLAAVAAAVLLGWRAQEEGSMA